MRGRIGRKWKHERRTKSVPVRENLINMHREAFVPLPSLLAAQLEVLHFLVPHVYRLEVDIL
jgi:hypothetical protein